MSKDNNKSKDKRSEQFSVLRGDLPLSPFLAGGEFVSAEATDTRLMGVVGVHILRNNSGKEFHQLFYLDFEEYGFDDYRSYVISDELDSASDLRNGMSEMFGGLGANWIGITEREAIFIIGEAAKLNASYEAGFPEGLEEFLPVLDSPISMEDSEKKKLWKKLCPKELNDYGIINYFIMRAAAMDQEAYKYLSPPDQEYNLFQMTEPGTLYRNEIKDLSTDRNSISAIHEYVATSIISDDIGYRLIVSNLSVAGPWVVSFELQEDMRISPWEASIILAKQEYSSVLKLTGDMTTVTVFALTISVSLKKILDNIEVHPHANGSNFMILRKDNLYAENKIYRLDNDVLASIYLANNGEIIIFGSDIVQVHHFESLIMEIIKHYNITAEEVGHFAFHEQTVGYYIKEEYGVFDSFLDFLQFLNGEDA